MAQDELSNWETDISSDVIDTRHASFAMLAEQLLGSSLAQGIMEPEHYAQVKAAQQAQAQQVINQVTQSVENTLFSVDNTLAKLQAEIDTMGGLIDPNAPQKNSNGNTVNNSNTNTNVNTAIGTTSATNQGNVNVRNSNVTVNNNSQQSNANSNSNVNQSQPSKAQQWNAQQKGQATWSTKNNSTSVMQSINNVVNTLDQMDVATQLGFLDASTLSPRSTTGGTALEKIGYYMGEGLGAATAIMTGEAEVVGVERLSQYISKFGFLSDPGIKLINPNDVKFSQESVSYLKQRGGLQYTFDDILNTVKNGNGYGFIDVVRMPDGTLVTIDNTRLLAARQIGMDIKAMIRDYNELLPEDMLDRFEYPMADLHAQTWGEAMESRILRQSIEFSEKFFQEGGTYEEPIINYPKNN